MSCFCKSADVLGISIDRLGSRVVCHVPHMLSSGHGEQRYPNRKRQMPLICMCDMCARPQVFVHALRKVDVRAMIGQTSAASVVVRGAATSRRVAVYSSHPDELQV